MRCGDTGHRFLVLLPGIVLPDRLSNPRPMLRENRPQEERTPHTGGGGGTAGVCRGGGGTSGCSDPLSEQDQGPKPLRMMRPLMSQGAGGSLGAGQDLWTGLGRAGRGRGRYSGQEDELQPCVSGGRTGPPGRRVRFIPAREATCTAGIQSIPPASGPTAPQALRTHSP